MEWMERNLAIRRREREEQRKPVHLEDPAVIAKIVRVVLSVKPH